MTTTPVLPRSSTRHVPYPRRPRRARIVALLVAAAAVGVVGAGAFHMARAGSDGGGASTALAPPTSGPTEATGLDPELERRFEAARAAAEADGVELTLTSGWRSAEDQQELVDAAVARYGSQEEARRWVLPPQTSEHVAGLAIDVGPTDGALWLEQHGAGLGLCRTYANELWHFEAVIEPGGTCPPMHEDASHGW